MCEVQDEEVERVTLENFIKTIEGNLVEMKSPFFYASCSNCSKKLKEDNSCG